MTKVFQFERNATHRNLYDEWRFFQIILFLVKIISAVRDIIDDIPVIVSKSEMQSTPFAVVFDNNNCSFHFLLLMGYGFIRRSVIVLHGDVDDLTFGVFIFDNISQLSSPAVFFRGKDPNENDERKQKYQK